jgi:hypothetical protein
MPEPSPEIIRPAVMMHVRFLLSLRNVEDLLHERAVDISHETRQSRRIVEQPGILVLRPGRASQAMGDSRSPEKPGPGASRPAGPARPASTQIACVGNPAQNCRSRVMIHHCPSGHIPIYTKMKSF